MRKIRVGETVKTPHGYRTLIKHNGGLMWVKTNSVAKMMANELKNSPIDADSVLGKDVADKFKTKCDHKYAKYNGFTDIYEYCVKCDAKKGII